MASGADIHAINAERRQVSRLKGGGLLSEFSGSRVLVLAISDVSGDSIAVIGSGLGAKGDYAGAYECRIVASNAIAREAVADCARADGHRVISNEESLYGDVGEVARRIAQQVGDGPPGFYIFGGEPTVILPDNPGQGGRNQALALMLARAFSGQVGLCCLVGGTDGNDGPTTAAGGIVDGTTYRAAAGAGAALAAADSGTYLREVSAVLETGPTGTNVMDLAIVLKSGG